MARPWGVNEAGLDQIARHWVKRTNARRYFRRAASKARRGGLKRDLRRQQAEAEGRGGLA